MKVDFRAIAYQDIDDEVATIDIAKKFGNGIFTLAINIEEHNLSKRIWKDGEVELTDDEVKIVKKYAPQVFSSYVLSTAIINAVEG